MPSPTADMTIVVRDDGKKMWAYKGKPLYTFKKDMAAGDTNGDGFLNGCMAHGEAVTGRIKRHPGLSLPGAGREDAPDFERIALPRRPMYAAAVPRPLPPADFFVYGAGHRRFIGSFIMSTGWIVLGVLVVIVLFALGAYNRLVALSQRVGQSFADIDVQLKQRHDLIPNLIETRERLCRA